MPGESRVGKIALLKYYNGENFVSTRFTIMATELININGKKV